MRKPFITRRRFLIVCMAAFLFAAANVFQYKYFTGRIRADAAVYTEWEREAESRYAELAAAFNARPVSGPPEPPTAPPRAAPVQAAPVQAERGARPERGKAVVEVAAAPPAGRTESGFTGAFMSDENSAAPASREPGIELPPPVELPQETEITPEPEIAEGTEIALAAEIQPEAVRPEPGIMPAVNLPLNPALPQPVVAGGRGRPWIPPISVGLGLEANNNNRKGMAEGVTAAVDFRALSFLAAGARAGFSSNFGYSNTAEGEGFVRLILPLKTPLKKWELELFAQGGAGISQIFIYEETLSGLLAGGGIGARMLNKSFYIEALLRAGIPFLWGAGLSAGWRFGNEE